MCKYLKGQFRIGNMWFVKCTLDYTDIIHELSNSLRLNVYFPIFKKERCFKLWSINSPGYYVYKRLTASQADVLWSPVFWHQERQSLQDYGWKLGKLAVNSTITTITMRNRKIKFVETRLKQNYKMCMFIFLTISYASWFRILRFDSV